MLFSLPEFAVTRLSSRDVVSLEDPAIAWPASEEAKTALQTKYWKVLDASLLPSKPGERPVIFQVSPVPVQESDAIYLAARRHVRSGESTVGMAVALDFYRAGAQRARNVPVSREGDTSVEYQTISGERMAEVPFNVRYEIGLMIQQLSTEFVPGFTSLRQP